MWTYYNIHNVEQVSYWNVQRASHSEGIALAAITWFQNKSREQIHCCIFSLDNLQFNDKFAVLEPYHFAFVQLQ